MFFILLITGCALDPKTKTQCETQSDCIDGYECSTDHVCRKANCELAQCGNQCGAVEDGCGGTLQCGICPPPNPCTGTCLTRKRLVFTTSAVYQGGKLGGLDGADAICQNHAKSAQLTGTYRAWLSDATGSPLTRMIRGTGDYTLVDGTLVAHGWDDLVDGQLMHAIDLDETGAFPLGTGGFKCMGGGITAWTGTDFDGARLVESVGIADESCGNWSAFKAGDRDTYGLIGDTTKSATQWTRSCSIPCTYSSALYCIEQ